MQLPRLLHFGEARVLDADGRHIGHHGEQAEIVLRELAQQRRRIHVNDPDDLLARLQRHRHQGADVLLDDAAALAESVVDGGVAHQDGVPAVQDAIAHGGADAETFALVGADHEFAVFERHQNAAIGFDGVIASSRMKRKAPAVAVWPASSFPARMSAETSCAAASPASRRLFVLDYAFEVGDDRGGTGVLVRSSSHRR